MAEKTEFPLNFTDEFRAKAEPWLKVQVAAGNADYRLIRDVMRGMMVTPTPQAAEAYARDLLAQVEPGSEIDIRFMNGMPDNWHYQVELKCWNGAGQGGLMRLWFSSDHLCRILTRIAENYPHVEFEEWPREWPKPAFKRQAA